jgi:two-component system, OmpR family, response regulator VicR
MSRVLVVEDHPPLATVVAIGLRRLGHEVVRVGSVERALSAEGVFDGAVVDIELPDGTGVELARELLDSERVQTVIFYTATRDPALKIEALKLGPIVDKMGNLEELLEIATSELERVAALAAAAGGGEAVVTSHRNAPSGTRRRVR